MHVGHFIGLQHVLFTLFSSHKCWCVSWPEMCERSDQYEKKLGLINMNWEKLRGAVYRKITLDLTYLKICPEALCLGRGYKKSVT